MARIIRNTHTGPYKIEPKDFPKDGKSLFICMCGLSSRLPICDGSHKACLPAEQPGMLYEYDPVTKQVIREIPDPGAAMPPSLPE